MKVSIIVPCYNERDSLQEILDKVKEGPVQNKEVILVDDGSNDGTTDIIKNKLMNDVDKVVFHAKNMGKGVAVKSGLKHVSGDMVIIQDADLEYDPMEYPKLVGPIIDGKADVVYGSRFVGEGPHRVHMFWHYVGNKLLTLFSNMFSNLNLTDMETCYKAFRTEVIKELNIEEKGFGIEPELTVKLGRKRCRVYEVGISYYGRSYNEGKKITWKDGIRAVYVILKYSLFK